MPQYNQCVPYIANISPGSEEVVLEDRGNYREFFFHREFFFLFRFKFSEAAMDISSRIREKLAYFLHKAFVIINFD